MQKYIFLFISFIVIGLMGCGTETPAPNKNKSLAQIAKEAYARVEKTSNDSTKPVAIEREKQLSKERDTTEETYNQIIWDGNKEININNNNYFKHVDDYLRAKIKKEQDVYLRSTSDGCTNYVSPEEMWDSSLEYYCSELDIGGFRGWYAGNSTTCHGKCHASCYSCKVDFIDRDEKISFITNYLITKKYNLEKGMFEKTSDFQKKVQYVKDNIDNITNKYMSIAYNITYGKPNLVLPNYDADNEIYYATLSSSKGGMWKEIAISVPLEIAKDFYSAHKKVKVIYQYKNGKIYLKNIIVTYNNKNYMAALNKMNYKPSDLKVALYKDIEYGEKLIAKLNNDIPKLLKQSKAHKIDKHKWLFIVGIENYEYTNPVKYSTNSAKEFKAVMKKRLGIPENNCRTLLNHGATASQIDYKLKDMLRRVKRGDTIYFYYSGHGIPVPSQNNTPYMLAQDMNPAYLNDKRFQLQTIYKELSSSKASKVIAFIDSCFSGGTDNQSLIKGVAATRLKPKRVKFNTNKMVVISAGSGTQYSNKYDEKANRLFSYYVMKGLIKNNSNLDRLYAYIKSNVQEKSYEMGSSYEQVPVYDGNIKLKL